ncbi:hypothetical protein [Flavobacterium orientale]|uniref:Uncharacterized protein n=1 Tax=Flavobacterium orientale TaxID=1756020 RepID=A0A917DDD6_9FLAO|nr:hypothetical protein [Flavobacterium orientale]GGD30846.1 hypothetical protein GCM10011343_21250 [Flavobacterium orientale]
MTRELKKLILQMINKLFNFFNFNKKNETKIINLDCLVNCLGYSINSDEFKNTIKYLNCSNLDESWNIRNKEETFRISFHYKSDHENRIATPKGVTTSKDDEPIVYYISFKDLVEFENLTPNLKLPYSLKANDSKKEVHRKIGLKPYYKQKIYLPEMKEGSLESFDCPNFEVESWYDENDCLYKLLFGKITMEERGKMEFDKKIKEQLKYIQPEFVERVKQLKNEIPDLTFGSDTNKILANKIENELAVFVENCTKYTKSRNPKAIINSVKNVVEKINDINCEGIGLIETIEREAICEFIDEVLKSTGLQNINEIDITEEWREW